MTKPIVMDDRLDRYIYDINFMSDALYSKILHEKEKSAAAKIDKNHFPAEQVSSHVRFYETIYELHDHYDKAFKETIKRKQKYVIADAAPSRLSEIIAQASVLETYRSRLFYLKLINDTLSKSRQYVREEIFTVLRKSKFSSPVNCVSLMVKLVIKERSNICRKYLSS